jgi:hypothetical protein
MSKASKKSISKRLFKHLGQVTLGVFSATLMISPAKAIDAADAAKDVVGVGAEGGKAALNEAFKVARSKPALSVAAGIVCVGCMPAAGIAASPAMCIACGILVAKVIG